MPATRAAIWAAGSLFLLGLIWPAGCGPNGVRKGKAGTGGEETGGEGGDATGGAGTGGRGTGGATGGAGTGGGTGGAMMPDAAPDVGRDVAADLPPDLAPDVGPDLPPDVMGAPCATSMGGAYVNNPFAMQAGTFTATFDATPTSATMDTLIGLSDGAANALTDLAVIIRLGTTGNIDARNGASYQSASTIPYAANMTYSFRVLVNVTAHTFSAYVKPPAGAEQLIGMNFAFRTEQAAATRLNSWTVRANATGGSKLCNFAVQ
jgi:hypothetical protein